MSGMLSLLNTVVSLSAQAKNSSTPHEVHLELVKLLGKSPSRALMSSLTVTDKEGKSQQDMWALLDLLEAAHLILWTDMMRIGRPTA